VVSPQASKCTHFEVVGDAVSNVSRQQPEMADAYLQDRNGASEVLSPSASSSASALGAVPRASALSSRITSVLSASYADLDIRDALQTLDARGFQSTQESRRNLRLDLQQEVIQCNGEIVRDFGQVAEVDWLIRK
jgi:hypothetical protein